ncbi:recombinase family protein [Pseudoalteromonas sp. MMG012]|uniref:recombinase zinc beta ribbon domain-containing protein n=1 Tax=Pseudoalteromonas sp. MMG012 TaxID=2822686 RepID=UPI001B39E401|nr:recombinase family protein [Pseudoalteromonas sp. MMG012]MBQ4851051.1 recombinase zinc beta ribbon domain-containing protein [Pseudoalteromonas sp. MMG012]
MDRQSKLIRSWLNRHPECELEEEIVDEGISAYTGKNISDGALGEYFNKLEQGLVQPNSILLVEDFSRFTRQNLKEAEPLLFKLWDHGISFAIANRDKIFDPSGRDDIFSRFQLLFEINHAFNDSEYRSKKVKGSYVRREENAKQGIVPRMRRPFWLDKEGKCNQFRPIIEDIFALYLSGQGQRNILNAIKEKYPDAPFLEKTNPSTVMDWISKESVIGMWRGNKVYEAAIDEATYYQAQDIRENRKHKNVKPDSQWPLTGLIRCKGCGCGMSIQRTYNKQKQRYSLPLLRCSNTQRKGKKSSECTTVSTFPLIVAHYFFFEYSLRKVLERLTKSEVNKERQQQESMLNSKLAKLESKLENYRIAIEEEEADGNHNASRHAIKHTLKIEDEIEAIQEQLQALNQDSHAESAELILPDLIELLREPKQFNTAMHRLQLFAYLDGNRLYFDETQNFEYQGFDKKIKKYVVKCDNYPLPQLEISSEYYSEENLFYPLTKMTDEDIAYWKHAIEIQNLRQSLPAEEFTKLDQHFDATLGDFLSNFDKKMQEIDDDKEKQQRE